jgi:ATP-binding cassette subfamily F protein 3
VSAATTARLTLDGVTVGYDGRPALEDVTMSVPHGAQVAIVGPNGAGKSTFIKLLAGKGDPELDTGHVKRGTNLQEGYFDQHLGAVNPSNTAIEEVRSIRGDLNAEGARQYLARFRFWGDDPLRVVAGFSGGERSRLALAKLLLEPRNLLFLDEPTNHLDIPAAEILEEALVGFDGTVLLVSHDRRFLETVTTRIVSVRDGNVEVYPGGFSDFAAAHAPPKAEPRKDRKAEAREAREAKKSDLPPAMSDAARKKQHDAQKQSSRDREKRARRFKELEDLIAAGEKQLGEMREKLREDPAGDWAKLAKMAAEEQALAKRVDLLMAEWTKLGEELSG